MGAFLSLAGRKSGADANKSDMALAPPDEFCKRRSIVAEDCCSQLIPKLPDELSAQILARLPRIQYPNAGLVSRKWKAMLTSPELFNLRRELGTSEEWLYLLIKCEDETLAWHALDPLLERWQRLPPMPSIDITEEPDKPSHGLLWNLFWPSAKIAGVVKGWLGRKDAAENHVPYCGCAVGVVEGCLYVVGGFSKDSTLKNVRKFDPVLNVWSEEEPMSAGRAYCKIAVVNNKLFAVGGVSRGQGGLTPIQSAEAFDPRTGTWSEIPGMPFSRAQVFPTPFYAVADTLKPIATGITQYRGKLFVPQSLYSWPFFVDVGGEVYDPETNSWLEMPSGMREGWPAKQAGTKISVVLENELYAFEPSSSLENGKIKVYDHEEDAWKVVIGKVPVFESENSESPYLLAAFHGKLQFISRNYDHEIQVIQADVGKSLDSLLPSPSFPVLLNSVDKNMNPDKEYDTVIWKKIASRQFGSAKLVIWQVLNI
ncbi:unnamed protein product [Rhodiola kirilowii]